MIDKEPPRLKSESWPFCWLFAVFFVFASGCGVRQWRSATSESSADNSIVAGHFVGKESTNSESGTGRNLNNLTEPVIQPNSSALLSVPHTRSGTGDNLPPILAVRMMDHIALGIPIGLFTDQMFLMRNDGAIQQIKYSDIVQQTVLNDRFHSIDRSELAKQLRAEFGRNYSVKSELPYLVVARPEHIENWCKRFRSFHHSFSLYCSTHGLKTREMDFPLVAVVFGSRTEFQRYSRSEALQVPESVVGYYMPDTNRILLYESASESTHSTERIICHEATHQLAFNTGLHQRRASTPLWLAEGFASMFEAPMLLGTQGRDGTSLWPESRQHTWQLLAKHPESIHRLVTGLIQNDLAFESDAQNAYTVAWAMTTYLSRRSPKQFGPYLNRVSQLRPFEGYQVDQRIADFQSAFGADNWLLSKKIIQYLESLE